MAIDEDITLRKLEIFLSFMQLGSMSAVAQQMGLSAVSVHRALHSLEEGLRCPLFKREGRSLLPLKTATTFAEFAQRSIYECEEGVRRARLAAGFESSRIMIGCGYSLTVRIIPQLVYGLKTRRPHLNLELKLGATHESVQSLRNDQLDAALVVMGEGLSLDEEFVCQPIYHDPLCFAVPVGSKYAHLEEVDLRALKAEKFVALHEEFVTVQAMRPLFEQAGFAPQIGMRAGNLFALANLVAEGMGCALLPKRVGLFTNRVQLIPLAAPFAQRQTISLLLPKAKERNPNLLALIAECRSLPEFSF